MTGAVAGLLLLAGFLVIDLGLGPDAQEGPASQVLLAFGFAGFAVSTFFLRSLHRLLPRNVALGFGEVALLVGCAAAALGVTWAQFAGESPDGGALPAWAGLYLAGLGFIALGHAAIAVGLFRTADAGLLGMGPLAVTAVLGLALAIPWEAAREAGFLALGPVWAIATVVAGLRLPRLVRPG